MNMHTLSDDFVKICKEIYDENKSLNEWSEIESDDMFQRGSYVGGFDSTEEEFCFSVFIDNNEYWFQISLSDIPNVINGKLTAVKMRKAE